MERDESTMYFSYPDPQLKRPLKRIPIQLPPDPQTTAACTDFTALAQAARASMEQASDTAQQQDQQGIRQLEALRNIGLSEQEMELLRKQLQEGISAVIDEVFAVLVKTTEAPVRLGGQVEEMDLRTLKKISRDGESLIRNGRELAEDLVIGSLVNWGNEVWDPNDPSTSAASSGNLLIKMLQQ
ncbi:hypothetical protein HBDW_24750 [Herbaspirillum sp. DW155]|uniref:hypothetical protein n=1 Tax=Herbaspirillum sp. DW155 TaxID=3095609 RepID=UPI003088FDC1|nr:hypothetical protein HBDW_24750 [Herbaspirillum sp. DW155]